MEISEYFVLTRADGQAQTGRDRLREEDHPDFFLWPLSLPQHYAAGLDDILGQCRPSHLRAKIMITTPGLHQHQKYPPPQRRPLPSQPCRHLPARLSIIGYHECLVNIGLRRLSGKVVRCTWLLLFQIGGQTHPGCRSTCYGVNIPGASARLAEDYNKLLDL